MKKFNKGVFIFMLIIKAIFENALSLVMAFIQMLWEFVVSTKDFVVSIFTDIKDMIKDKEKK